MTKKVEEEKRVKKEYAPRGQRSQKMVSFRCDDENLGWLQRQPSKGRLLNDLIKQHREQNGGQ